MEEHQVVPDVIDEVPKKVLEVTYPSGVKVNLGNELTPTQVKDQPKVTWQGDPSKFYTLLMIDPDAPSRQDPKVGGVNHWLVVNIPGSDLSKGDEITGYCGSGPPNGTGLHRYIFFVYGHDKKLEFDEPRTGSWELGHRMNFKARNFAEKYNLNNPVFGNFYQAQYDSYVDEMMKRIKQ